MTMEEQIEKKNPDLFDRIFKPKHIVLENGHSIDAPQSRLPLILSVTAVIVIISLKVTNFNFSTIVNRIYQMWAILGKIFQPDWSFFKKVTGPLMDTIKMSILGSITGSLLALPFGILASSNIIRNRFVVSVIRFILGLIRTLPTLIIANICALIFSLGTFSGTVAIAIFTFGVVAKMLFESIETIDMHAFEAMEALGADKFRAFWSACIPQILPTYLSHCIYSFEMNIRAASILGYVGAGGLGILINERVGWRDYNGLGMVLLTLFVVVVLIDSFSEYLRSKLA